MKERKIEKFDVTELIFNKIGSVRGRCGYTFTTNERDAIIQVLNELWKEVKEL